MQIELISSSQIDLLIGQHDQPTAVESTKYILHGHADLMLAATNCLLPARSYS